MYEGGSPLKSIKMIKCPDSASKLDNGNSTDEKTDVDDKTPMVTTLECTDDLDYQLEVYDKYESNRIVWNENLEHQILETISEQQSNFEATSKEF